MDYSGSSMMAIFNSLYTLAYEVWFKSCMFELNRYILKKRHKTNSQTVTVCVLCIYIYKISFSLNLYLFDFTKRYHIILLYILSSFIYTYASIAI